MREHICKVSRTCRCWILSDTPDEDCPKHGYPIPRCDCGRFVSRPPVAQLAEAEDLKSFQ